MLLPTYEENQQFSKYGKIASAGAKSVDLEAVKITQNNGGKDESDGWEVVGEIKN